MIYDPYLPKLDIVVVTTALREISRDSPGFDPEWVDNMLARIKVHDPVFYAYLKNMRLQSGELAANSAMFTYRMFESQISVNQLEAQFSENI